MTGWAVDVVSDRIAERAAARPVGERRVVVYDVSRPTVVLGSSQGDDALDREAVARAGAEVVHRRSGGSAVLVEPGAAVWIDVTIPAGDPRWDHDVGRAFHWLGRGWVEALAAVGHSAEMHDGPLRKTGWSPLVCFAGLGPGEVTIAGRKVVGLSQRRTREAALFQCCATLRWEPERLLALLALDDATRTRAAADLAGVATGLAECAPGSRPPDLAAALIRALATR